MRTTWRSMAALAVLLALTAGTACVSAESGAIDVDDNVTVIGSGQAVASPDVATVILGVEVTRPEIDAAFGEADRAMGVLLGALRELDVADEDLRTEELSVRQQREGPREPPAIDSPEAIEFTVTNLVRLTIRDVDRAGELISAAVDAGGEVTRVAQFRFVVDDDRELMERARTAAFEDARRRAELYSDLSGRSLGELVSVSEVIGPPGVGSVGVPAIPTEADAGVPIEPGEYEANVQIQVTWRFDR